MSMSLLILKCEDCDETISADKLDSVDLRQFAELYQDILKEIQGVGGLYCYACQEKHRNSVPTRNVDPDLRIQFQMAQDSKKGGR